MLIRSSGQKNRKFLLLTAILGVVLVYTVLIRSQQQHGYDDDQLENRLNMMNANVKLLYHKSFCECKIDQVLSIEKTHPSTYSVYILKNGAKSFLYNISSADYRHITLTCEPYKTLRRGWGQKVISLAIVESDRVNFESLKKLAVFVHALYPNWIIRIYHDGVTTIEPEKTCEIECLRGENDGGFLDNTDFCDIREIAQRLSLKQLDLGAHKWKLMPLGDTFVDVFVAGEIDEKIFDQNIDYNKHVANANQRVEDIRGFFNLKNQTLARNLFNKLIN